MENVLKNRSLQLFVVVILFLAILAFYFGILQPANQEITAQNAEIQTVNKQISILTKKVAEKNANISNISFDKIQASLPIWDNTEELTLNLSALSHKTNVVVNNLAYAIGEGNTLQPLFESEKPVYPDVKEVTINITINGTYDNIYAWIDQLDQLPRLISIGSINLEKPISNTFDASKIVAALTLTAYFDPSYKDLVKEILVPFKN